MLNLVLFYLLILEDIFSKRGYFMKIKQFFVLIMIILTLSSIALSQDSKYAIGISYGFQDREVEDIWVGDPYNIWIDQTSSNIFGLLVRYRVSPHFELGLFTEFESGKIDVIYLGEEKATKLGFGTTWIGKYPATMVHFQLGGFMSYNIVFPEYERVDNETGIDYGIIVGPAIEYQNYGLSIHFHAGHAWYPTDSEPDEFGYANSKIKLKLYYIL